VALLGLLEPLELVLDRSELSSSWIGGDASSTSLPFTDFSIALISDSWVGFGSSGLVCVYLRSALLLMDWQGREWRRERKENSEKNRDFPGIEGRIDEGKMVKILK
jgi:hypothetical protein